MNDSTFSQDPASVEFNTSLGTVTGRKARLGDPNRVHPQVASYVRAAHQAIERGFAKIGQLADDKTRSVPERHAAARTVANQTIASLEAQQRSMNGVADRMLQEANEVVEQTFAPASDPAHVLIQHDVAKWIGERAVEKDGLQRIREEMKTDRDIAIALIHGKPYLKNLNPDVRMTLAEEGYRIFLPDTLASIEQAADIRHVAGKYSAIIGRIPHAWFNNALAAQAATRVSLDE